jgi:hypothetical protein
MLLANNISEAGKRKLQLYAAAMLLYDKGKSHPQIVTILEEQEPNREILIPIVDKAMYDEWDKLYADARKLFSEGLNYDEVWKIISKSESDKEIVTWICTNWYNLKTLLAECLIEGVTNRFEGMKGIIICGVAVIVVFLIDLSWIAKGIWIAALVGSIIQWIVGMQQRDIKNKIDQIFSIDIDHIVTDEEKERHI